MSPLPFALAVTGTVAATALVGAATVFLATREEGFHHAVAWRVHLADFGRGWTVQILEPGRVWETLAVTPREYGRDYAIATAKATIDARRS